jgi:general secretion pathway protein G
MKIPHKNPLRSPARARAGFSLAEMMVVIVIIGLLATLVVPNVLSRFGRAQEGVAINDITQIATSLNDYVIANGGRWPDSLESLVTPDEKGFTYLNRETVPLDPWKNEYQYEPPSGGSPHPNVWTFGKDGEPGGEGENRDITYEMIRNGQV